MEPLQNSRRKTSVSGSLTSLLHRRRYRLTFPFGEIRVSRTLVGSNILAPGEDPGDEGRSELLFTLVPPLPESWESSGRTDDRNVYQCRRKEQNPGTSLLGVLDTEPRDRNVHK